MRFGNKNEGESEDYQEKAKRIVKMQYNIHGIGTPKGQEIEPLDDDDIYVVWFAKTLQNWKCLLSTTKPDDRYYELTHDGDRHITFIDTYLKTHNLTVPD